MATAEATSGLQSLLDQLIENTDGDQITLDELLEALDSRSYGPLLLLIAVVAVSPIGGIPGMSVVTGTLILVLCSQMLAGQKHPWLPDQLLSMEFPRERLQRLVERAKPWAQWIEQFAHRRWAFLAQGPALKGVALVCILLAATFYPLAVVPFGVFAPGSAVALLALGVTTRDGIFILLGYLVTAIAVGLMVALWPF